MDYLDFLKTKIDLAKETGFEVDRNDLNPALMSHQKDFVWWLLKGGRRALFASYGLGKTCTELEFCHQVVKKFGGKALIICPLGVRQEFSHDAIEIMGYPAPEYVRTMEEVKNAKTDIVITNYERVRDGDIEPTYFVATSLDEASVLRDFGSKTYQTFLDKFKGVPYKLVATATPSPNKYKELIHYSGYLEVMPTGQALTRFFQRDSTKANNLTLYPNREEEFWLWISSWAMFCTKPSDLNPDYSDDGYILPELEVRWHEIPIKYGEETNRDGQFVLFNDAADGLSEAAHIKGTTIDKRVAKLVEIVNESPDDHFVLWHDREAEREAIQKALPEAVSIWGNLDLDEREKRVIDFSEGRTRLFATKKSLSGSGCNFQKYCHREIFVGIDYEANDFLQAIHRCYRFLQDEKVIVDIIYMESERQIKEVLLQKWKRHDEMVAKMIEIVKKYGLNNVHRFERLNRKMGCEEVIVKGEKYTAINNDCVEYTRGMETNSVDLIHTSIPFGNHYEYSLSYNDFGCNENDDEFFKQMNFLTPELFRVLKPGRVAAIHVKDRVLFGNATGTGMPTIEPFHADCIHHYIKHGFQYFGMITVVTDVVRENNQTYRLGWTEQCKDGSKMGVGCPEYILLFRKLPTDRSKAYADVPVSKTKEEYTRAQWQIDAHAYWRSSGDRMISKDELSELSVNSLQAVYRKYSRETVYNYHEHVELAKKLDEKGKLPAIFMVVAPGSWNQLEVWDDINRMRTLNTNQSKRRLQMHVCLAEGSLILTRTGYKKIEDIEIGDLVLTHKGNWKPVIAKACTGEKETIQTKAQGVPLLITTPDHKLWSRLSAYFSRPKDGLEKAAPDWHEAQELGKGNGYVNLKLPEIEESNLTAQEWWLVGMYISMGYKTGSNYRMSIRKDKFDEFSKKVDGMFEMINHDGMYKFVRLTNLNDEMKKVLDNCMSETLGMEVPIEGICLNKELSESLLSGYIFSGRKATTSRELVLGLSMVAQRARGIIPKVFMEKVEIESKFSKRKATKWRMIFDGTSPDRDNMILDDGAWKKVTDNIGTGIKTVWSIQVADDASYTAEGCIVKNCPLQLDVVERIINRYSNKGDVVYDPFGGLMTVPMTAVKMGRYGIGCELNPDYFRDGVGYLQAAENDVTSPTLFDFLDAEDEEGEK